MAAKMTPEEELREKQREFLTENLRAASECVKEGHTSPKHAGPKYGIMICVRCWNLMEID